MKKKDFRILVADDDEIARDVVLSLLSNEGYSVVSAVDGLDALRMLRMEEINLVITDLIMPGADGIEVLKYAIRSNPDIAVVLLTAYGTLDNTLSAIKEGAYDYLTKPFKVMEIISIADRAFERAVLINENREMTKYLRATYRDMELLKSVTEKNNPDIIISWIERIDRLKTMNILSEEEMSILKERLINGYTITDNISRSEMHGA